MTGVQPASRREGDGAAAEAYAGLFREVFDRSLTAMIICDHDRRIVDANDAASQLTGYSRSALLAPMLCDALWEPAARPALPALWHLGRALGSLTGTRKLRLAHGGAVPVRYSATADAAPGRHLLVYIPSLPAHDEHHWVRTPAHVCLTPRQRQIVTQLALGLTSDEVAANLMLSPNTVATHVRNAMRAASARNRAHLVAQAMQRAWIVSTD